MQDLITAFFTHSMNDMTLAIDGRCLQGGQGGIEIYTRSLLNEMLILAPQYRFIIFFNGMKQFSHGLPTQENVKIVTTRIPSKLFHILLFVFRRPFLDRWIECKAHEKIDVLLVPNLHFFSVSKKAKVIATLHDLSFMHYRSLMSMRSQLWHTSADIFKIAHLARRVIAVSESTRSDLERERITISDHIRVIPLGIDRKFFMKSSEEPRLPMILAFCPQERRKNIITLIAAFARARQLHPTLKDMKLVIGGMKGSPHRRLLRTIQHYQLTNAVRFLEYVSMEKRISIIKSCSLLVYPSIYEGFGMPPLEACAAGIPVITAAHSSIMEVCGDAVWYIDPYNIEQIGQAIVYCLSSEFIRHQAQQRGPRQASQFTWRTCARRTLEECERLYADRN